jgi:hypothetical protein
MTVIRYSKNELLSFLPVLPPDSKRKLMPEIVTGLKRGLSRSGSALLKTEYDGRTGVVSTIAVDPKKVNANRRKLMILGPEKAVHMRSINDSLRNEPSAAETAFGFFLDVVGLGTDVLCSIGQLVTSKPSPAVLARQGDEVWQLERFGKIGTTIQYVDYLLLVDPLRARAAGSMPCEWIIHEERMNIL